MTQGINRSRSKAVKPLRRLLSEPLVQFLLAGVVLLTAQHLIAPAGAQAVSPDRILVSREAVASMQEAFLAEHRRAPSKAETEKMVSKYVDGEVLYREALRFGLDRSDVIVRREMQRKMRFLIEDVTPQLEPTRDELQAWLNEHADEYTQPQRIDFQQVFLSRARHGKNLELEAGRQHAQLRATDAADFRELSDPFTAGLEISNADHAFIAKHFGSQMAEAILGLEQDVWSQPLRSSLGLHIVRVTRHRDPLPLTIERAGKRLIADYKLAKREEANERALEKLRARYAIEIAGAS